MIATSQRRLQQLGYDIGAIDGIAGPLFYTALFKHMGARDDAAELGKSAARHFPTYGITTPLRIAHWLAQAAHETGGFRYRREIWGPTDAQRRYEGRADLGNCIDGDGKRFLGRGVFQCTGRDNYARYGKRLGIDLTCNPELAEQPDVAVQIACLYWTDHNLNQHADRDDGRAVGNGINRGNASSTRKPNGHEDRMAQLAKVKRVLL